MSSLAFGAGAGHAAAEDPEEEEEGPEEEEAAEAVGGRPEDCPVSHK